MNAATVVPDSDELGDRRVLAEVLARKAGAFLLDGLLKPRVAIETKSSGTDMVSEMDKGAETLLVEGILKAFPNDGILGEEGTDREGSSPWRWVIDPLDGTTNYLYGHPFWSVSVGIEWNGIPVVGVVDAPTLSETYGASLGHGTTRNGSPVHVSNVDTVSLALTATGFGYSTQRRMWQGRIASAMIPQVRDLRRGGSAAIDLAFLASGRVDAYFERGLNAWDMCAGIVLVREAGGTITNLTGDGEPTSDFMVGATAPLHPKLRSLLASIIADTPHESTLT
jgi:myo-inositol-1(or 4)-monophosphatase